MGDVSFGVHWRLAAQRGRAVVPPGPRLAAAAAAKWAHVAREAAHASPPLVADITGLRQAAEVAATVPVTVTDRPGWITATARYLASIDTAEPPSTPGARLAGHQAGLVLAILARHVLGQYLPATRREPQLVLNLPTMAGLARQLQLPPADFTRWVCLHETTHAVQFAAAPWLAPHFHALVRQLEGQLTRDDAAWSQALGGLHQAGGPAVPLVQQVPALADLLALTSLLEGHADVVMDAVGPQVVPSAPHLRAVFTRRRTRPGLGQRLLRRLLGADVKLQQYQAGAEFVRHILARHGHAGLNRVFAAADQLPRLAEISAPTQWEERVLNA